MTNCPDCGERRTSRIAAQCRKCGRQFSHAECYPEQYSHPQVGRLLQVTHQGKVVARGKLLRVMSSRFGTMAKLDAGTDTYYLLSSCQPVMETATA